MEYIFKEWALKEKNITRFESMHKEELKVAILDKSAKSILTFILFSRYFRYRSRRSSIVAGINLTKSEVSDMYCSEA